MCRRGKGKVTKKERKERSFSFECGAEKNFRFKNMCSLQSHQHISCIAWQQTECAVGKKFSLHKDDSRRLREFVKNANFSVNFSTSSCWRNHRLWQSEGGACLRLTFLEYQESDCLTQEWMLPNYASAPHDWPLVGVAWSLLSGGNHTAIACEMER